MKAFTDLEQSKKLAEFLPLESADMYYEWPNKKVHFKDDKYSGMGLSCWSLAALLDVLDYEIVDEEGVSYFLNIYKEDNQYQLCYSCELYDLGKFDKMWTDSYDDFVDACVEMIIKLHELKML